MASDKLVLGVTSAKFRRGEPVEPRRDRGERELVEPCGELAWELLSAVRPRLSAVSAISSRCMGNCTERDFSGGPDSDVELFKAEVTELFGTSNCKLPPFRPCPPATPPAAPETDRGETRVSVEGVSCALPPFGLGCDCRLELRLPAAPAARTAAGARRSPLGTAQEANALLNSAFSVSRLSTKRVASISSAVARSRSLYACTTSRVLWSLAEIA